MSCRTSRRAVGSPDEATGGAASYDVGWDLPVVARPENRVTTVIRIDSCQGLSMAKVWGWLGSAVNNFRKCFGP